MIKKFRKTILVFVCMVVLLPIIIASGCGSSSSTSTTTGSSQQKTGETPFTCSVEGVGKVKGVTVSDVGIAITDVETVKSLGSEYFSENAKGEFKVVGIVVNNNQKDAITVDSNSYKIIDSQGREYSHSVEGETALQMSGEETFFITSINPGITTSGYIVFDIPKGLSDLKLKVQGGFSGKTALLPLQVVKAE